MTLLSKLKEIYGTWMGGFVLGLQISAIILITIYSCPTLGMLLYLVGVILVVPLLIILFVFMPIWITIKGGDYRGRDKDGC